MKSTLEPDLPLKCLFSYTTSKVALSAACPSSYTFIPFKDVQNKFNRYNRSKALCFKKPSNIHIVTNVGSIYHILIKYTFIMTIKGAFDRVQL